MKPRKILITGAAGVIARDFRRRFGDRYQMRLADVAEVADPQGHEVVKADIGDLDQMQRACDGIDTVIHLAGDPRPNAPFETLLPLNIVGTYNVFQAARDCGCQRVVLASSIHAVINYPPDHSVRWDMPVNPTTLYGVSKCFGEALARYHANHGLSGICIRIGAVIEPSEAPTLSPDLQQAWISPRDLAQLIQRCIDVEGVNFAIVHGLSRHPHSRLEMTGTHKLLGYEPADGIF